MLDARMAPSRDGCSRPAATGRPARRQRVLMITYDFPPPPTMAGETCAQIARYLPLHGWDPVVLAARHGEDRTAPSDGLLPSEVIRAGELPHPIFIYKRLVARSRPSTGRGANGTPAPGPGSDLKRWVLSMLQVPDTCTGWIPPAVLAGLRAIRRHQVTQLFSASPHSTGHLVGLALARLSGLPWTAQFQDPWTYPRAQWRESKPLSALSARLETALERVVVRRANVVACVTERHRLWLRHVHPDVRDEKLVTIPNGFDGAEWERVDEELRRVEPRSRDRFLVTYAGNLYHRRSPLPLFRALSSLLDSGHVARERVQVDLLGHCDVAGGTSVSAMAEACGLAGSVTITGPLGRMEALRRVARSDLLLLLAEGLTQQIPGKTYEYLRTGQPILALTGEGATADLLSRTGGAWVVDPGDLAGVAAAVLEAYRRWQDGRPGPTPDPEVVAGFDRRVLCGQFAAAFERVAAGLNPRGEGLTTCAASPAR